MRTASVIESRSKHSKLAIAGWAAGIALIAAGAFTAYVAYGPLSIPDVGAPFDVEKFVSVSVPDSENAWTYYRRAATSLVGEASVINERELDQPDFWSRYWKNRDDAIQNNWARADGNVRRWVAANQPALEIWKRGTDCSDALAFALRDIDSSTVLLNDNNAMREFARLAMLEAARVTAAGRPADAWVWYRATLRSGRHLSMQTGFHGFLVGSAVDGLAENGAFTWAARAEISAADLRQAVVDVESIAGTAPPISDSFKAEYVCATNDLATVDEGRFERLLLRSGGYPKRVQRYLNLVYANLLSQVDRPRFRRMPASGKWALFELDSAASGDPKVLSPAEIERYRPNDSALNIKFLKRVAPSVDTLVEIGRSSNCALLLQAMDDHRARQNALVVGLALQLHFREHGRFPDALDELVKSGYLASIPTDPFGKGEPFHYRRETDAQQGAALWSVWHDGVDQHGKVDVERDAAGQIGDKVFHIAVPGKSAR